MPPLPVVLFLGPALDLTPSTREGPATRACGLSGFAYTVIAALGRTHGRLSRGDDSRLQDRSRYDVSSPFDRSRRSLEPCHHLDGLHHRLSCRERRIWRLSSSEYDGDHATMMVCIAMHAGLQKASGISAPARRCLRLYSGSRRGGGGRRDRQTFISRRPLP